MRKLSPQYLLLALFAPTMAAAQLADLAITAAATSQLSPTTATTPPAAPDSAAVPPATLTPATPPSTETSPPPTASALPEFAPQSDYSYGNAAYSIMFSAEQIEAMKSALRTYERVSGKDPSDAAITITQAPVQASVPEPAVYPVFYLSSIVYHNAKDWAVWLKQAPATGSEILQFTPKTMEQSDVKLLNVSATQAEFAWNPPYGDVLGQRYARKSFTPTNDVSHRLTAQECKPLFDEQLASARFLLKQNQSFSSAHFACFEGEIAPAPSAAPGAPAVGGGAPMSPAAARNVTGLLDPNAPKPSTR